MTATARITGARLEALRISPKTVWIFVHLSSDDGLDGIGEATLPRDPASVMAAGRRWLYRLSGLEATPEAILGAHAAGNDLAEAALFSALDMAAYDLAGQRDGQPVHQLLGGSKRQMVPVYANINRRTVDRSPAGFAASAGLAVGDGYGIFKLAPFDEVSPGSCRQQDFSMRLQAGLDRIGAVRNAIGPARKLRIDCHWRFDRQAAGRMIDACRDFAPDWIECPIVEDAGSVEDIVALRRHANGFGMRLAGLEMGTGIDAFRPFLAAGAYDVIMPDVKYLGGLALFAPLAAEAKRAGAMISPHNPTGPVCHAASLHVAASLDNFDSLEFQYDESPLFDELAGGPVTPVNDGKAQLPADTGLGITLDQQVVDGLRISDEL